MKRTFLLLFSMAALFSASCQEKPAIQGRNTTIKWAPAGLILGSLNLQGEYNLGNKNSLTAKIGVPVKAFHTLEYEGNDASFEMKAISFMAGYRMYLSKKHLKGFYFEPFFKYVHHTSEGEGTGTLNFKNVILEFTNDYNAVGIGAQLGIQFRVWERVVIDFYFLGPELNSATNKFKAVEINSALPWNTFEAAEAEKDIRAFIDKLPFIRNKTKVMVDSNNRKVTADFKGVLPGFRTGVSLGIAL